MFVADDRRLMMLWWVVSIDLKRLHSNSIIITSMFNSMAKIKKKTNKIITYKQWKPPSSDPFSINDTSSSSEGVLFFPVQAADFAQNDFAQNDSLE